MSKKGWWVLFWLLPFTGLAQIPTVQLKGYFLKDTVEVGQTVRYVLLSVHAPEAELVFPDSSFKFAPFELVRKEFYPTRTQVSKSVDSTIYLLRTFSLSPVQKLQVHAQLFLQGDTLQLNTLPDSLFLRQLVTTVEDPLPLRSTTQLQPVPEMFNYLYWGLGGIAGLVLIGGIWGLFGKRIINRYKLYVLQKYQNQFQSRFQSTTERFKRTRTLEQLERGITLWKNYLTKLEEKEISSFTTKEITNFYEEDEQVGNALKVCDRAIYGNIISDDISEVTDALTQLSQFAALRFVIIRDSLRNVANTL
ncbi:hypothetical protein TH61_14055 [Rufibacter sp. DG15C]|uniref:hypothetical protein n=1 Tax=Rufibacter sp. DG15C TaxID=1379909 RepID=UPI00078C0F6D|nr:hypothetical protein [Rufibacter sp. DG15C]AMM52089.1 hypothetical protein TH61_14055 [Rufibacter sp. DG15C]